MMILVITAFVWRGSSADAAIPAPGGIDTGLVTWQKANDGTSTTTSWQDSSGNGNTLTGAATVQANGINFNPSYSFNGGQWFNAPNAFGIAGSNNFSGFITLKQNTASPMVYDGNNGGASDNFNADMSAGGNFFVGRSGIAGTCGATTTTTSPTGIPAIGSYNRAYPNISVDLNAGGTVSGLCDMSITGASRMIGRRNQSGVNAYMVNGLIGEYIVYNRSLPTAEARRVQSYLATKYGITLDQTTPQNYVNSSGNTIWTGNATYKYNITGIGRDDNSALNQKQSKSVNKQGLVTVGQGTIVASNVANPNNFSLNNSFLLFGDDNGAVNSWTTTGVPTLDSQDFKQIPRKWRVQKTGTVDPLTISFDVNDPDADIVAPLDNYYLLNLTTGTATLMTSGDGSNYSVGGVTFNDGDVFTIGTFDIKYNVHFKKTVSPVVTSITPGQTFTYTVTAQNLGNTTQSGLSFFDDLSDVLDDAAYNSDVSATVGSASFNNGNSHIDWSGTLSPGQTATVTYSLTMNTPDTGNGRLDNGVVASGTGVNCTEDPAVDPDCLTTTPLPVVTSQKTLVSPASPKAGDTVNYQFVITNQGGAAATTVPVADDLTEVLDDATYNNDGSATSGTLSYNPLTKRLSWSGSLAANGSAGDSVTVTYSVRVNAATALGDAMLNNAVISPDCPSTPIFDSSNPGYRASCVTSNPVSAWTATKSIAPVGELKSGDKATYTIAIKNTGATAMTNLSLQDDMTNVLDDADYNNDASATVGTPTFASHTLSWLGNLNAGQSATMTYSVTVKAAGSLANSIIANAIGAGPMNCPTVPTTNVSDPTYTASCAVSTAVSLATSPSLDSSSPDAATGSDLAQTGEDLTLITLAPFILISIGLSLSLMMRKELRSFVRQSTKGTNR
jgi:fimbrial isopeptide formation D2 family protein